MRDDAGHPVGVIGGGVHRPGRRAGQRDQHGALGGRGVQHGENVCGALGVGVGGGAGRLVRPAAAPAVERHHPVVQRQVADLGLPELRPDDLPGRQQQHGRSARRRLGRRLEGQPDVAPFGNSGPVGQHGPALRSPHRPSIVLRGDSSPVGRTRRSGLHHRYRPPPTWSPIGRDHGRISSTMLNGVCATCRNRVKPAAIATSRSLAGPACVPRASPTSWDSEAGVHSNVENP